MVCFLFHCTPRYRIINTFPVTGHFHPNNFFLEFQINHPFASAVLSLMAFPCHYHYSFWNMIALPWQQPELPGVVHSLLLLSRPHCGLRNACYASASKNSTWAHLSPRISETRRDCFCLTSIVFLLNSFGKYFSCLDSVTFLFPCFQRECQPKLWPE